MHSYNSITRTENKSNKSLLYYELTRHLIQMIFIVFGIQYRPHRCSRGWNVDILSGVTIYRHLKGNGFSRLQSVYTLYYVNKYKLQIFSVFNITYNKFKFSIYEG